MAFNEADIDLMLADSADTFTAGAVTAPCVLLSSDELLRPSTAGPLQRGAGTDRRVRMAYALIKTSAFPTLKVGDAVTVNGTNYVAKTVDQIQDGGMTEVMLGH